MKERIEFSVLPWPFSRLAAVFLCLAAAMPFVALNSVQAAFLDYTASAYGTYAFVGSTVVVGQTAPVTVGPGCGTAAINQSASGTVASVTALPTIQTGIINTNASDALNTATGSADVHSISLLGALITAKEVKAVSTTFQDNTGFHSNAAGSSLSVLKVGTTVFNAVPAPNTTIQLAGFGKVVLNEQIASSSATKAQLTVNMIHVYVTIANNLNIPVGTQIIVSHAFSGLTQAGGPGTLDGTAFGTSVNSTTIKSSPTAPASVGCLGNALITKSQVGVTVPPPDGGLLSSGTIQDTAQGSVTASLSTSETTSTVQNVNLLNSIMNGFITASVVHADAKASTTDGTTFTFSEGSGSYFTGLVVQGVAYTNVAANTKLTITLDGKTLGTLYLHRVIQGTNSITVRMIELVIASGNSLGLPTGMDIIVASASASLHSPTHP
jgi:hypothetical protein